MRRSSWFLAAALLPVIAATPGAPAAATRAPKPQLVLTAHTLEDYIASFAGDLRTFVAAGEALAQDAADAEDTAPVASTRAVPAAPGGACAAATVTLQATPMRKTHRLGFGDLNAAANANGVLVAAVRNLDARCSTSATSKFPNLGPGDEILVFVKRTAANTYRATWVYRSTLATVGGYWSHVYASCGHSQRANPEARLSANNNPCNDQPGQGRAGAASFSFATLRQGIGDGSVWVACSNDCCYST